MKKLVMAAAVLGAFAGTAQAQTSVTLYGVADGNLRFDHTNIGTLKSVDSGGESGSRWGIRGSEDLGGGLKANFIFEQGFDLSDNSVPQGAVGGGASGGFGGTSTQNHGNGTVGNTVGSSRLFGRTSTVGLSGGFGEFRFGRGYNPLFLNQLNADPFGAGFVAEVSNLYVNNNIRNDNAMYYDTPRVAGFQASGVYQLGESTTNSSPATAAAPGAATQSKRGNDRYGFGANYSAGPVYAGVGGEIIRSNLDTYKAKTYSGAGTYDFGFIKLHALFWKTTDDNPVNACALTGGAPSIVTAAFGSGGGGCGARLNERVYTAGVTVPFGAWTFLGLVSRLNDHSTYNVANLNYGTPHVNDLGLGFRYSLSKRSIIYVGYDRWNLKAGAQGQGFAGYGTQIVGISDASNTGLYQGGAAGAASNTLDAGGHPNVNPYSYQFGIRHTF